MRIFQRSSYSLVFIHPCMKCISRHLKLVLTVYSITVMGHNRSNHKLNIAVQNICGCVYRYHTQKQHTNTATAAANPTISFPLSLVGRWPTDVPHISQCPLSVVVSARTLSIQLKIDTDAAYSILPCPLSRPSYIKPLPSKKPYHSWLNGDRAQTYILQLHNRPAWQGQLREALGQAQTCQDTPSSFLH